MVVIGVDPGIAICGCAVVQEEKGHIRLLTHQAIISVSTMALPERLGKIYVQFIKLLETWKADTVALESLFFNTNAKTALIVGQARGVIQLASYTHRIPVAEYAPLQVKMAITGYGRANKSQIQQMTAKILRLPAIIKPDDVADAAAIALTHCFSYRMTSVV